MMGAHGTTRIATAETDPLTQIVKAACHEAIRESTELRMREERLLKIPRAAKYIGVSPREIYNMIENHGLPSVKHGSRRLIDIEDLDAWIKAHKE